MLRGLVFFIFGALRLLGLTWHVDCSHVLLPGFKKDRVCCYFLLIRVFRQEITKHYSVVVGVFNSVIVEFCKSSLKLRLVLGKR